MVETVKVKPWGKDQGEFVEINADDFDPKTHTLFSVGPSAAKAPDPFDHDGVGKPGGSRKGKRKV